VHLTWEEENLDAPKGHAKYVLSNITLAHPQYTQFDPLGDHVHPKSRDSMPACDRASRTRRLSAMSSVSAESKEHERHQRRLKIKNNHNNNHKHAYGIATEQFYADHGNLAQSD
jgi:hypothetical protein